VLNTEREMGLNFRVGTVPTPMHQERTCLKSPALIDFLMRLTTAGVGLLSASKIVEYWPLIITAVIIWAIERYTWV
jgi:hypothetical protein